MQIVDDQHERLDLLGDRRRDAVEQFVAVERSGRRWLARARRSADRVQDGAPESLGALTAALDRDERDATPAGRAVGPCAQQRGLPASRRRRDDRHALARRAIQALEQVIPIEQAAGSRDVWGVAGRTHLGHGEDRTFAPDGRSVIAATATLRVPASLTIDVAASWNTEPPPGRAHDLPASGNAQRPERWDASRVSRRCLIVDDNALYLGEARDLLQRQGMSIVGIASNGGEALAIAAAQRPDVALVDVDLGAESGLDVARALATCDVPVPVILISAYSEKDLRELLDDSPAVGFLAKSLVSRAAIDGLLE